MDVLKLCCIYILPNHNNSHLGCLILYQTLTDSGQKKLRDRKKTLPSATIRWGGGSGGGGHRTKDTLWKCKVGYKQIDVWGGKGE